MHAKSSFRTAVWIGAGGALVVLLIAGALSIARPNAYARWRVRSILVESATPKQQLDELERYVKLGDPVSSVHRRLLTQHDEFDDITRPTEWALGLGGVNLVLAVNARGRVVGIGRYLYDVDDGTQWLAGPRW